jgi:hypothetical protein
MSLHEGIWYKYFYPGNCPSNWKETHPVIMGPFNISFQASMLANEIIVVGRILKNSK